MYQDYNGTSSSDAHSILGSEYSGLRNYYDNLVLLCPSLPGIDNQVTPQYIYPHKDIHISRLHGYEQHRCSQLRRVPNILEVFILEVFRVVIAPRVLEV